MDPGPRYAYRAPENVPRPKAHIADGIRRGCEEGDIAPGTRFVTEAEHEAFMNASIKAAEIACKAAYGAGVKDHQTIANPFILLLVILDLILLGALLTRAAC